ncbi:hypothetical protein HK097_002593 [Rhizophlyctis rosea]|uniref:C2H2-type domain-containing protein n=1 Tax=Rhizophlyctis rosea TaxID=64517 RepID=A0AAD5S5T3_9FUNG|nr:hypothetical protein HK097_002593 [Rhizophlyctis rosea]
MHPMLPPNWPPLPPNLAGIPHGLLQQFQFQQLTNIQRQLAMQQQQLVQQQQQQGGSPTSTPGPSQPQRAESPDAADRNGNGRHHRVWEQDNGQNAEGRAGPSSPWGGDGAAAAVAAAAAAVQAAAAAIAASNGNGEEAKPKKREGEGEVPGANPEEAMQTPAHAASSLPMTPFMPQQQQGKLNQNFNELFAQGRLPFPGGNPLAAAALANANRLPYLLAAAGLAQSVDRQGGPNPFFQIEAIRAAARAQLAANGGQQFHDPNNPDMKHPLMSPLAPLTLLGPELLGSPGSPGSSADSRRKRRPSRLYTCNYPGCNKQFTRNFNLQSHAKTHDPDREKPFVCPECAKGFWRKVDLERHDTVHTKVKGHQCPRCDKKFTRKDALQRHVGAKRCAAVKQGLQGLGLPQEEIDRGMGEM